MFFVSERSLRSTVRSPWGARQPEPYYTNTRKFYAMPLDSSARFPFQPTDSWLMDTVYNPGAKQHKHAVARTHDLGRLQDLLYELPIKNGNVGNLQTVPAVATNGNSAAITRGSGRRDWR